MQVLEDHQQRLLARQRFELAQKRPSVLLLRCELRPSEALLPSMESIRSAASCADVAVVARNACASPTWRRSRHHARNRRPARPDNDWIKSGCGATGAHPPPTDQLDLDPRCGALHDHRGCRRGRAPGGAYACMSPDITGISTIKCEGWLVYRGPVNATCFDCAPRPSRHGRSARQF